MSWLFSQALAAAFLAGTCSDGEQFAPLKLSPTPQAYCSPDRMTEFCRLSRFGMTFAPLTADHGEALLTWYLEDSRARTSAAQEKGQAWTVARVPGYGGKCTVLFGKYSPDTCSWRTPQCWLLADWEQFWATWPRAGSMRSGWCWARTTWEPRTKENVCGFLPKLPTLLKTDARRGPENWRGEKGWHGEHAQLMLPSAVGRYLPTILTMTAWREEFARTGKMPSVLTILDRTEIYISLSQSNGGVAS